MSSTAPSASVPPHATAHTGAATRARAVPAPAPAHGGSASPFAALLQGAVDDALVPPSADDTTPSEPATDDDRNEASATPAHEPGAHGHAAAPAAGDATSAQPPAPAAEAPPSDIDAGLRRASLIAAARARLAPGGAEGAVRRGAAGLDASAQTLVGHAAPGRSAHGSADAAQAGKIDIAGLTPTLGARPAQLAPADAAPAAGAVAADFTLPSLGATPVPAPAPMPTPAQATLAPPPGHPAFPAALGAQLSTWLKDGVQYASLALNPQEMGPIDVRIALRDGRTEVQLGADVAATRAALAEALPALAEALGDVGLSLAGGSVSDHTGQHARQGDGAPTRSFALPAWLAPARETGERSATAPVARPAARGLIDLVA
jgi:flagellar hook-length control protein FliK